MTETAAREVEVYVALGSNVDPLRHVPAAVAELAARAQITGLSHFYQTAAIGRPGQPDFVNGVVRVRTGMSARDFKQAVLRQIEAKLGRKREEDRFAPRTIDLDILLYEDAVIDEPDLHLPDPEIAERGFLAQGLFDINPAMRIPGSGVPLAQYVTSFEGSVLQELTDALREQWLGAASGQS